MTLRCPECETAVLNTPRIQVQRRTRKSEILPFKVCKHCKVILVIGKTKIRGWKIWNGEHYLEME